MSTGKTKKRTLKIGGASGYWGESAMATPQLLKSGDLDYLVYDYLAEITMSIMARMKMKNPDAGYATDFVDSVMKPFLPQIAASGVKIIANAGGTNPESCGKAVRALIKEKGLELKVAVITGDDLLGNKDAIAAEGLTDMFSGAPFPPAEKIASINAYLGAFPIAKALAAGADIIITGRCVDSAVTLGACIYEFGWGETDWDLLASGSLAGHILECGPQATGGNFTDWEEAGDITNIGYPIAEISSDGSFITTKPENTGGIVNVGTVSEQMLYEIGDPQAYILPDVICDFSQVTIEQVGENRVQVSSAMGRPAPETYKTCLTYMDGFRAGTYVTLYGIDAEKKAAKLADAAHIRASQALRQYNLGDYTEFDYELLGAGSQSGNIRASDEVVMKIAVKHPEAMACGIFLKTLAGLGLATPPGLSGFTGAGRAKPSPVFRLFSYRTYKDVVTAKIDIGDKTLSYSDKNQRNFGTETVSVKNSSLDLGSSRFSVKTVNSQNQNEPPRLAFTPRPVNDAEIDVPLIKLAWGRSGDKGNKANIGIIARKPHYMPYIWAAVDNEAISNVFKHFGATERGVQRFTLFGVRAMNILIDNILGGGGPASLRNDAQGKGYAQILLATPVKVSAEIARELGEAT